jgi:uncharacterized protein YegP (UPF0339 family)
MAATKTVYKAKLKYYNGEVYLKGGNYSNGRQAIKIISLPKGELVTKATINVPDIILEDGEVIIKDYSENEGVLKFLQENNIVGPVLDDLISGFETVYIVKINSDLLAEINS